MRRAADPAQIEPDEDASPGQAPHRPEVSPSAALAAAREHEILITPALGWAQLNLRELWEHRELLYLLIWRNVKVRYKQTVLGAAWAVIPAVMTMVVFTLIFGRLAHLSSDGSPYALFSYCALVPWTYFSNSVTQASTSLIENERLVTRVYFPRLLVPLAACLGGLLDFVIAFVLLLVLALGFGEVPDVRLLAVPGLVALAVVASFAVGITLSALNVFYRDVRYVIAFLIQFWLFATPVAYSSSLIPHAWRPVYGLNPMAGVIDGFRWAVLGRIAFPGVMLGMSVLSVALLLFGGLYYFRRVEDSFADVV
jgi:lipopolysaccharide transport system permease protein